MTAAAAGQVEDAIGRLDLAGEALDPRRGRSAPMIAGGVAHIIENAFCGRFEMYRYKVVRLSLSEFRTVLDPLR